MEIKKHLDQNQKKWLAKDIVDTIINYYYEKDILSFFIAFLIAGT